MAAQDVLGTVSDRLVGGIMFHSEHADLCHFLGLHNVARLHEDGYEHDSACLRRVRRLSVRHLGMVVSEGRQERSRLLDAYRGQRSWDVAADVRKVALSDAMRDWVDWEAGTVSVLTSAHARLLDLGELLLADKVKAMAKDTSDELAHARDLLREMEACGWDMSHIYEM